MQPNLATAGAVRVGRKAYAERASGPVIVHLIGRRQGHDRATKVAVMTTPPGRRDHSSRRPAWRRGGADDADDADDADQDPSGEDYDPDATTRFMPAYASRTNAKNTAALVALAVALIAAVSSLAWLIGASVTAARPTARPSVAASPTSTPISTAVPKNATVCTPEVARSTNTSCTLARRVFSAVRTLGTDLPNTFRVTVTDPQTAKNATFVCSIKSWIQCVGSSDVTVYVQRQV
jgi:hypothetical protein